MSKTALQKYFKERLEENKSHVLVVFENSSAFRAPNIIKSVDDLTSHHLENYGLVLKGFHATIILPKKKMQSSSSR